MQYIIDFVFQVKKSWGAWVWVLAPVYIFVGIFVQNLQVVINGVNQMKGLVQNVQTGGTFPSLAVLWQSANYFFPVEAAIAMALFLIQLRIFAMAIRIAKTSVPLLWS